MTGLQNNIDSGGSTDVSYHFIDGEGMRTHPLVPSLTARSFSKEDKASFDFCMTMLSKAVFTEIAAGRPFTF